MAFHKLCITGSARTQQKNPITARYAAFFFVFIVEDSTGRILDLDVTSMLPATNRFLQELFMGRSLAEVDKELLTDIRRCYLASSQKAIQSAYLDAVRKYRSWLASHGCIMAESGAVDSEG